MRFDAKHWLNRESQKQEIDRRRRDHSLGAALRADCNARRRSAAAGGQSARRAYLLRDCGHCLDHSHRLDDAVDAPRTALGMHSLREGAVVEDEADLSLHRFAIDDGADSGELQAEALIIVEAGDLSG